MTLSRVQPSLFKTLPIVRLAIVLTLVLISAVIMQLSPWDSVRATGRQSNTAEALLHALPSASGRASADTLEAKLLIPKGLARLMSNFGVTPIGSITVALGVILVLLILSGIGFHTAAQASRESEERFARIFQSSPLAITISTQKEGRYVDVNDAYLQMLRYQREEIIGHSSLDLNVWVEPEDRVRMLHLKDSGPGKALRTRMRTSRGEIRHVAYPRNSSSSMESRASSLSRKM